MLTGKNSGILSAWENNRLKESVNHMGHLLFIALMGLMGALIGWSTNVVAIRLLFRPYEPQVLPLVGWSFQGLIPKRRQDIARALGEVISTELITEQDVAQSLGREDIKGKIMAKVRQLAEERVLQGIPAHIRMIVPLQIQLALAEYAGKTLSQEVARYLRDPRQLFNDQEAEEFKTEIKKIVENKVLSFEMERLEELTFQLARRELKHIEWMGGILGLAIGLVQGFLAIWLQF